MKRIGSSGSVEQELLRTGNSPQGNGGKKVPIPKPGSGECGFPQLRRTPSHESSSTLSKSPGPFPNVVTTSDDSKKHKPSAEVSCWQATATIAGECFRNCFPNHFPISTIQVLEFFDKGNGSSAGHNPFLGIASDPTSYCAERL